VKPEVLHFLANLRSLLLVYIPVKAIDTFGVENSHLSDGGFSHLTSTTRDPSHMDPCARVVVPAGPRRSSW